MVYSKTAKVVSVRPANTKLSPSQVLSECMNDIDEIEEVVVLVRRRENAKGQNPMELRSSELTLETAALMNKMLDRQVNAAVDALI